MDVQPLVSVRTVTYNQEKYIAACLEGILMQHTDFPFEVIVGEHSSSDRTQEIVLAYQAKYPEKIHALITGRDAKVMENAIRTQQACRGKYQALCEGDDYWIDPLKLQKQVDFLESHPDVTMCFTNAIAIKEDIFGARLYFASAIKPVMAFEEACGMAVPTATVMARREVFDTLPDWRVNILWSGDRLLLLWSAHLGKLGYLSDITAVYRRLGSGMSDQRRYLYKERLSEFSYIYQEFDKSTHYEHTNEIQELLEQRKEKLKQDQMGAFYFLLHPRRGFRKLKDLYLGAKRHRFVF
jgi:glycosyltransferase involved in cell wall biosynthesis